MALVVYQGGAESSQDGNFTDYYRSGTSKTTTTAATGEGVKRFVGLANQGATCYLNGLLQTLFMTPEFRKAIFSWNYDANKDGEESFCIPYQLQRLFGLLQLSSQRYAETVPLTRSFGWEGSEVFQQQDVQELTRVLFDALEESFRGTDIEHIIDDLYAGELIDYLRCIDVDYQSERKDKFLDFSLAIVPFGNNTKAMGSLTECIEMFLRPELLDGDNQYYVESFQKKVDAIKGLKFGKLPKLMSVQLKRFVYDFSGSYVVQKKLNDQVKFPMILDMNKYVATKKVKRVNQTKVTPEDISALKEGGDLKEVDVSEGEEVVENDEFESFLVHQMEKLRQKAVTTDEIASNGAAEYKDASELYDDPSVPSLSEVSLDPDVHSRAKANSAHLQEPDHDVIYESMTREQITELVNNHGEWIYELYAVLIHSGAISGGHYYAYIKDFATNQWYNFNDSSVTPIDEKTVQEAWGGSVTRSYSSSYTSYYSSYGTGTSTTSTYQSSANAYMLMYRQVTNEVPQIPNEIIPTYIQELVKVEQEKREAKLREEEELRNRLNIRVLWKGAERIIPTKRTATYHQFIQKVWEELELYKVIPGIEKPPIAAADESQATDKEICVGEAPKTLEEDKIDGKNKTTNEDVKIPPPNIDLFRIRDYNHYTKLLLGGIDYKKSKDSTLSELTFSDYKVYYVETRQAHEEWEEYYPDGFSVLLEEFDLVQMNFKEPRTIRLPAGSTVIDLKERIAKFVSYDINDIRIMKILSTGYHDGKVEIFDNDTKRLREDCYVYDGTKLYCEQATSLSTPQESLAFEAYLNQRNRLEIKYNKPPSESFDYSMFVDSRWKVQELRQKLADELKIPVEKCRLFKLNSKSLELKDGDSSLTTNGVYNGISIAVAIGKATRAGYYPLSLSLFEPTDTILGVKYLPVLEPETEEVDVVSSMMKKYSNTAAIDDDEEGGGNGYDDLYEEKKKTTASETYTHTDDIDALIDVNPTLKNIPRDDDADMPNDSYTAWITDERNYDLGDDYDEGDNLSNKGVADDCSLSPVVADDYIENGEDSPPPLYAEVVPLPTAEASAVTREDSNLKNDPYYSLKDVQLEFNDAVQTCNEKATNVSASGTSTGKEDESSSSRDEANQAFTSITDEENGRDTNRDKSSTDATSTPSTAGTTASTVSQNDGKKVVDLTDVEPSDFGERMVRHSISSTQFIPLQTTEEICVQNTTKVDDLRVMITEELIKLEKVPPHTSPYRIRIRDRYSTNPGKILRNGKMLTDLQVYLCDNKSLAVQILPEEEILPDNDHGDVIVLVQRWHRSTWSLSERSEILLPGNHTVRDVARGLSELFHIPLPNLRVLVVPKENSFYLSELVHKAPSRNYGRAWFDPTTERKLMRYMSHDLRVQDGDLVIIQDIEEPLMILSPADLKSIEIVETANNVSSNYSSGYYYGTVNDYSRYGNNAYPMSSSSVSTYSYGPLLPGTTSTSVGTSTTSSSSYRHSQGIKIKTHKDRMKSNNAKNEANDGGEKSHDISVGTLAEMDLQGIPPNQDEAVEDVLKSIQDNIDDIDRTESGYRRNNSPIVMDEGTSTTDDLFRMISDPHNPEYRHFLEDGGLDQYDFMRN